MKSRRIFASTNEIIEIVSTDGQSALKVKVFRGNAGNLQAFIFSQPEVHIALDPSIADRKHIIENDPAAE